MTKRSTCTSRVAAQFLVHGTERSVCLSSVTRVRLTERSVCMSSAETLSVCLVVVSFSLQRLGPPRAQKHADGHDSKPVQDAYSKNSRHSSNGHSIFGEIAVWNGCQATEIHLNLVSHSHILLRLCTYPRVIGSSTHKDCSVQGTTEPEHVRHDQHSRNSSRKACW